MTSITELRSIDQVASGRDCRRTGDHDLAADYFRIAYRTEIARIVDETDVEAILELHLVRPWSITDIWAGWAALSLYHRANREGLEAVEFYSDRVPQSSECAAQGCYWTDYRNPEGVLTRILMPDVFLHVHTELARSATVRTLLPDLIQSLFTSGQRTEAAQHEAEMHTLQAVRRWP